jgi:serine phosphatase RsbU (regulator of sigma subunit)
MDGIAEEHLHPGDRLLLYTDGVTEARDPDGVMFGTDRLVDFVTRASAEDIPTPETMRRLVAAIQNHQQQPLHDDATVVFLEWMPPVAGLPDSP